MLVLFSKKLVKKQDSDFFKRYEIVSVRFFNDCLNSYGKFRNYINFALLSVKVKVVPSSKIDFTLIV